MLKFRSGLLCSTSIGDDAADVGGGSGLSISQAISELNANDAADAAARKKKDAPADGDTGAADTGADDAEIQAVADATADTETADTTAEGDEATQPGDAENVDDNQQAEAQPIEPPRWWSKEKKALFAQLTPELQAVVFEQEDMRERVVSKAKQESSDARKAAEAAQAKFTQQLSVIEPIVTKAKEVFADRWANVDWPKLAQELTAEQYNQVRARFEADTETLKKVQAAHEVTSQAKFNEYVKAEAEKLKTVVPDLVDEKLGQKRRADLWNFLTVQCKFPVEAVKGMSAEEAGLAYDAMRWRAALAQAQKAGKKPTPAQQQQQRRPQARSSAAPSASAKDANLKALQANFNKNPSAKNLEALMNAGG